MEFSAFWLWIAAGVLGIASIIACTLGSWLFILRCLALMPTHAYTTPCQIAGAHDFLYRPFLPFGFDQEFLRLMLPALERNGYVTGIEYRGFCYCRRAYMRLPPPTPKRAENPLAEPGAIPAPA